PSRPDSNSSGTSTTAARTPPGSAARQAAIRSPTRGHSSPSSHSRSAAVANATRASAERSTAPSRSMASPNRSRTAVKTSSSEYSSCTTASVERTAAPARSSALRAVDFPAPIPPVSPTNGVRSGFGVSLDGLVGGLVGVDAGRIGGRCCAVVVGGLGVLQIRELLIVAGEHVLGQAELGHVVEIAGIAVHRGGDRPDREHLALDPLDRQRQAPALGVDLEDLDPHRVARLDDLARVLDVVLGQLGDVHEALDPVEDLDERAERDDLGDRPLELVAHVVGVDDALPRVLLGLFETQRDPLALAIDVEHLDRDLVSDGQDLGGMVDVRPGQLGDVDQAVDPVEVHERAEVDDVRDRALHDLAGLQAVEDPLAVLLALLLQNGAPGQDHVVARAIELNHLALDRLAHVLVEIGHPADVDQRGGQEAAHPEVDDQAALDHFDDRALDRLAGLGGGFDAAPRLLEAGALLGQDQASVLILLGENEGVDLLAEGHLLARIHGFADRKL